MTPDQELLAAAKRLNGLDVRRGTPLHTLLPGVVRLLTEYGTDWEQCPEDHPDTRVDEAALDLARAINGGVR